MLLGWVGRRTDKTAANVPTDRPTNEPTTLPTPTCSSFRFVSFLRRTNEESDSDGRTGRASKQLKKKEGTLKLGFNLTKFSLFSSFSLSLLAPFSPLESCCCYCCCWFGLVQAVRAEETSTVSQARQGKARQGNPQHSRPTPPKSSYRVTKNERGKSSMSLSWRKFIRHCVSKNLEQLRDRKIK